jgi:hypothetical protein
MKSTASSAAIGTALLFSVASACAAETRLQVTTFAGTGEKGYAGDGGPAIKARLNARSASCAGLTARPTSAIR